MNKFIGYILSVLGLITIALSSEKGRAMIPISFIQNLPVKVLLIIGGVLIVAGVIILIKFNDSSSSGKIRHASDEVPIYSGKGKHRKIVGYQKEN